MAKASDMTVSEMIKEKAAELGFDICGIARARPLKEREAVLKDWCSAGMNDGMSYLARDIEKRIDPGYLVPGAKSLIVTGLNYYSHKRQSEPGVPLISIYAYGETYQTVIKRKLNNLFSFIRTLQPDAEGRSFVDTAPIAEKGWAVEAGLGCQGRNSVVINKNTGSFFFIGILVLNTDLDYDKPFAEDLCVNCRICIDLCPTGAINENRTIDARKCISNITINREAIPDDLLPDIRPMAFGCDICQEVCPWNRDVKQHTTPEFDLSEEIASMNREEWLNLSEENFNRLFKGSAIKRRKYEPFMRNVTNVTKQVR